MAELSKDVTVKAKVRKLAFVLIFQFTLFSSGALVYAQVEATLQSFLDAAANAASQGQHQRAIEQYKNALQIDPHNYESLFNIANQYGLLKDPAAELRAWQDLVALYPEDPLANAYLAMSYVVFGEIALANRHYDIANVRDAPMGGKYSEMLGDALARINRYLMPFRNKETTVSYVSHGESLSIQQRIEFRGYTVAMEDQALMRDALTLLEPFAEQGMGVPFTNVKSIDAELVRNSQDVKEFTEIWTVNGDGVSQAFWVVIDHANDPVMIGIGAKKAGELEPGFPHKGKPIFADDKPDGF